MRSVGLDVLPEEEPKVEVIETEEEPKAEPKKKPSKKKDSK